jgi:hypothetical protein
MPHVREIFGDKSEVAGAIGEGDLILRVCVKTPLEGRPNAHGILNIVVPREVLDDYLLQEYGGKESTDKFLAAVRAKQPSYVPKPSERSGLTPEVERWIVTSNVVRV